MPGYKQVGSVFPYTPPVNYIDNMGRGWQAVNSSVISHTVTANNNVIVVEYRLVSKPLSADEVTIKYVEQNDINNVLRTTIIGQIEIDTLYEFTADTSFTNTQGTWDIVGNSEITHTVLPTGNVVYVYYTKTIATTPVTVKYIDASDENNILYQETGTVLYVGQTYPYTIPRFFAGADGGVWEPIETSGAYTHTVTIDSNDVVISFNKIMADVTINYLDYENTENILYTETLSMQVGTSYAYENAAADYVDIETGEHWDLVPEQDMSVIVSEEGNEINIQYIKRMILGKVTVNGIWNNINDSKGVVVVITDLVTGKRYNGILKNGESEEAVFKYLPLGTYSINCINALNMEYLGSDKAGNAFTIDDENSEIEVTVTNGRNYPSGFHSLDSADNRMKIFVE